jgi:hypothetical protein
MLLLLLRRRRLLLLRLLLLLLFTHTHRQGQLSGHQPPQLLQQP